MVFTCFGKDFVLPEFNAHFEYELHAQILLFSNLHKSQPLFGNMFAKNDDHR